MAKTKQTRAENVIAFIETLKAPDGAKAGHPIILMDWQKHIINEVYGPVDENGKRIVRQAVLSVARKNGKTCLIACLMLCHLVGPEAIRNGQLYSLSIDREQASILANYATKMIYMDDELSSRLNVIESRKHIVDPVSGSKYVVLSGEKKGKMGKSASFICFDELAEFGSDRTLYDALQTSTGAHEDPLSWVFSTQAQSDFAVLSELIDYGAKVNRGEHIDPTFKSFVFEIPMDLDIYDEANWPLANPALSHFRSLEEMRNFAQKAKAMPSAEMSLRNLYGNQRVDAAAHFISPDVWRGCGGEPETEFSNDRVFWGGLDLSSKNDLSSFELVSQAPDGVWDVLSFFWAPGDNLRQKEDRDRAPYTVWRDKGFLIAKPGKVIDYAWVAAKIGELREEYNIAGIKFDRWRIADLQRELNALGIDNWILGQDWKEGDVCVKPPGLCLIPHGQGFKDFTPAVECLEDLLMKKALRHGMHPVLTWCVSNTRIQSDSAGGRKFDKLKSTGRIDGCVALAMALNGATSKAEDTESIYEQRGILSF